MENKKTVCEGQEMHQELLGRLRQRYARVEFRDKTKQFEIAGIVLLSMSEATLVVDGAFTPEEVLMFRNRPAHLVPDVVRQALNKAQF